MPKVLEEKNNHQTCSDIQPQNRKFYSQVIGQQDYNDAIMFLIVQLQEQFSPIRCFQFVLFDWTEKSMAFTSLVLTFFFGTTSLLMTISALFWD